MLTLYGIPNCDQVKAARSWLAARGVPHGFHDYKKLGVPADALAQWMALVGWEALLNRQGTTWRKLESQERDAVVDGESAASLMQRHPSLVRRPVAVRDGDVRVGFSAEEYGRWLG